MSDWKPEVGVLCLYEGEEVEVTGAGKYGWLICRKGCSGEGYVSHQYLNKFSPLKTEADKVREKQIQEIKHGACKGYELKDCVAACLYDAGCRMTRPLTEEVMDAVSNRIIDAGFTGSFHVPYGKAIAAYVTGEEL